MPKNLYRAKKNLVVGAGFSGAVMAERLASVLGEDVLVIDKNNHLGGVSFDYKEGGINVSKFGSHIFHTNYDFIWKYLNRFSKFNTYIHKVSAFVDGNFLNIPFNLNSIYQIFPPALAKRLENKLLNKYGYNAKIPVVDFKTKSFIWDRDLDFLASYIYENIFTGQYEKQSGGLRDILKFFEASKISVFVSKDDRFYQSRYQGTPKDGYTKLIENILNHKNSRVLTGTDFKTVDTEGFDRVFYTGSIDEFFDYKYGVLGYRSSNFEFEEINTEKYQNTAVVNYPNDYDFIKIHEFKHYSFEKIKNTIIAKEYPADYISDKNERLYPILSDRNLNILKQYKDESKKLDNVYFLGRLGDFKYYSMDSAVKRALELFDSVKFNSIFECSKQQIEDGALSLQ